MSGAVGLALDTACYSYLSVPTGALPPSAEVRVLLNSTGTTELARYLGPRVSAVDGTLATVGGDGAMGVAPSWVQIADGARQPWSGEGLVTIPRAYVNDVQRRTLNRRQTTISAIALAVTLVVTAVIALRAGGAKGAPDASGGGPPTR